jgi:hypothetical protein
MRPPPDAEIDALPWARICGQGSCAPEAFSARRVRRYKSKNSLLNSLFSGNLAAGRPDVSAGRIGMRRLMFKARSRARRTDDGGEESEHAVLERRPVEIHG